MLGAAQRLQQFDKSVMHGSLHRPESTIQVQKISRRRHRSLEVNNKIVEPQSSNTIHATIRESRRNQTNNDQSLNAARKLLSFSSILVTQSRQTSFNQSLSVKSAQINETHCSSQLRSTQTTRNDHHLITNLKRENIDLNNTDPQMNNSQSHHNKSSKKSKILTIKSARVIPNQNEFTDQPDQISNENYGKKTNQPSNKSGFIRGSFSFMRKKNTENTRYRSKKKCCFPRSRLCVFGSILGILLLGAVIGAVVVAVLFQQKTTTTVATATAETTSVTTATATTTTSVTTTTTTTTRVATSTTTTNLACGSTCVNTTVSTSSRLAFYSFDNVTTDATNTYPASGIVSPIYVPGWIGLAISFNYSNAQFLSAVHIPIDSRSFTIDFWFYPTYLTSSGDFCFAGQNQASSSDECLFLNIRNAVLYFGFFNDDTIGVTTISMNKWYHVAFVYDNATRVQYIYLNGLLDTSTSSISPLQSSPGSFTIGGAYIGGSTSTTVYYSGYIDHFTISSRVKTACEIYLDATLACYFTFDSTSSLNDSGPNFLTATNIGATSTMGRVNQALQFSLSLSYITVSGISALTSSNTVFTISMWVNPTIVTGGATLIHASTQSNGQGTCLAMWGLTSSGIVTVNVMDSSNNTYSATASSVLPLNTWTHIAQIFSSTTGNYLYINGTSVASASISAVAGRPIGPYTILGASPASTSYCKAGSITMGQFYGSIDEYRVFGRALTTIDICRLANPY